MGNDQHFVNYSSSFSMKKFFLIIFISISCIITANSFFKTSSEDPVAVPPSKQRTGDADKGYEYLITGDYIKSGIPASLFRMVYKTDTQYTLNRKGINKNLEYQFTAVKAFNGEVVIAPNCLQCHAQVFDGKLVVGMGNSLSDYTIDHTSTALMTERFLKNIKNDNGKKYAAAKNFVNTMKTISSALVTPVKGVNVADHLAYTLVSHRNPVTLAWSDSPNMPKPALMVPTDVPAWWLLKKKNAMFYNGFGRGDFGRFLMASNLLTVEDTVEAKEVDSHFNDVLAYIFSIKSPAYPLKTDLKLADAGKMIFTRTCAKCHGNYGADPDYPNLLIPASVIKTDSLLYAANFSDPRFISWFNQSWFTIGDHPAKLVPYKGYIAPPLDGVWATAPYLHNGSVPSLEMVINSKSRPVFWKRDFKNPVYNYTDPGWQFEVRSSAENSEVYNTTLPGYNNSGHNFGDKLNSSDRKKLLEYLKTL